MFNKNNLKKGLISVLLLVLSLSFLRSTYEILQSTKRLTKVKEEVEDLKRQKEFLEKTIAYKESDAYIEQIARNELNLVRPEEEVYVVKGLASNTFGDVLGEVSNKEVDFKGYTDAVWYMWYRLFVSK